MLFPMDGRQSYGLMYGIKFEYVLIGISKACCPTVTEYVQCIGEPKRDILRKSYQWIS